MTELIHSLTARWPGAEERDVFRTFAHRLAQVIKRRRAHLRRKR